MTSALISGGLFLLVAYLIHQKLIDWAYSYTSDGSALDELSFRALFVQNMQENFIIFIVIVGLYIAAVATNPALLVVWKWMLVACHTFFEGFK